MGCAFSKCSDGDLSCAVVTSNTTTNNINELEIDLSHFNVSSKVLGVGGFGIVRSAQKISGQDKGKEYALKTMCKFSILNKTSGPQCVLTELRVLSILADCKYICNVHYAFQDRSHLYMAIDIAPGGDMRYNLRATNATRFSEYAAKLFICQVFIALEHCHQASVLHRDVKPENILMSESGYLKLTDFGVAKILDNIEECRSTSGTHGYMAPEIYESEHIHGTPAEWFATGVTLHEFLTGRRPFEVFRLQSYKKEHYYPDPLRLDFLETCDYLTTECKDFLRQILRAQAVYRLGSHEGLSEIASHPWLAHVDWAALREQRHAMPYVPDLSQTRCDISAEDMKKVVQQSLLAQPLSERQQMLFAQYEYRTSLCEYNNNNSPDAASSEVRTTRVGSREKNNAVHRSVSMEEVVAVNCSEIHHKRKRAKVEDYHESNEGVGHKHEHRVTLEEESKPLGDGLSVVGVTGVEVGQRAGSQQLTGASEVSKINLQLCSALKQPLISSDTNRRPPMGSKEKQ